MNWSHPAFEVLTRRIGQRTGLTFTPERLAGVEAEIRRAMARVPIHDPEAYGEWIEVDPDALDDLMAELTVGETYFFREPGQFAFLRDTALPELRRSRGDAHAIRAWSAACSSGEEAYSLAIALAREAPGVGPKVLATDISRAALAKARAATYGPWSLRGEGAASARPYLRPVGGRFEVVESIRSRVVFQYLNLATDDYPSFASGTAGLDLIFCRNVLIYLDARTVQAVIGRLCDCLAEGGWLVTASSDPPLASRPAIEAVTTEYGVFHRRGRPPTAARPARDVGLSAPALPTTWHRPGDRPGIADPPASDPEGPAAVRRDADRDPAGLLAEARADLARGRYAAAVERTRELLADAQANALHIRALANLDPAEAGRACAEAAARHPFAREIQHLGSVVWMALGQDIEAARAARRLIYLDRDLAIAHFNLGTILRRLGDRDGARRAFRNARDLCAARPADEVVPLADGERAGRLAEAAGVQVAQLDAAPGGPP